MSSQGKYKSGNFSFCITETTMHADDKEKKFKILVEILKYPGESSIVDYKAAILFQEGNEFSHKLVKHILGMANAGGGYIVIGFKEDAARIPQPDPDLSEEIVGSYEITRISQFVSKFTEGDEKVKLHIHKVTYQGKTYPIIEIEGFKECPFFCGRSTNDGILKKGDLYFRDSFARTVKIAGSSEFKQLIDVCVRRRQSDRISQIRALFEKLGFVEGLEERKEGKELFVGKWIEEKRRKVAELIDSAFGTELRIGFWEIVHWLPDSNQCWDQRTLLEVAEKAQLRTTGWPIGVVLYSDEHKPKPLKDGIEATIISKQFCKGIDYWFFSSDGAYFFARTFDEDFSNEKSVLWFDVQIWRIAESLLHCIRLYNHLGIHDNEKIAIQIYWHRINERVLRPSPSSMRFLYRRKCKADEVNWKKETTLNELSVKWEDFCIKATNKLFLMFDFFTPEEKITKEIIGEFKKRTGI